MLSLLMRGWDHDSESKDPSQRQVLDSRAKRLKVRYPSETSGQRLDLPQQTAEQRSVPHAGEPVHKVWIWHV